MLLLYVVTNSNGCVVHISSYQLFLSGANSVGRRILLYFTVLHPNFEDMGHGSKFSDVQLSLQSIAAAADALLACEATASSTACPS